MRNERKRKNINEKRVYWESILLLLRALQKQFQQQSGQICRRVICNGQNIDSIDAGVLSVRSGQKNAGANS